MPAALHLKQDVPLRLSHDLWLGRLARCVPDAAVNGGLQGHLDTQDVNEPCSLPREHGLLTV